MDLCRSEAEKTHDEFTPGSPSNAFRRLFSVMIFIFLPFALLAEVLEAMLSFGDH